MLFFLKVFPRAFSCGGSCRPVCPVRQVAVLSATYHRLFKTQRLGTGSESPAPAKFCLFFSIIQKDLNRNKRTNTFRIAPKKQSSHIRLLQSLPYELLGCTRFAKPRQKIEQLAFFCYFTNILYHFAKKSASDLIKTIYFVIT